MTPEEMESFNALFGKYCKQERTKRNCNGSECQWCPIRAAYREIFLQFDDDANEDDEDED